MREVVVQLLRRFTPADPPFGDWAFLSSAYGGKAQRWHEMESGYRVLILAEPGAGKTFEARDRAHRIRERGKSAFFIRIEKVNAHFEDAFEVGTGTEFDAWLTSNEEAWFFLDSVDEAQLETPRALEEALRIFAGRIHDARERAHIFITSREDAWQALSDHSLIDQYLPYGAPPIDHDELAASSPEAEKSGSVLKVFRLAGLKPDEIKLFASHYGVGDVNAFIAAVERANLMILAERPFDLKALIAKWQADRALGSRLEVLRRTIDLHLAPLAALAAKTRIDAVRTLAGVQALAAAVTMTGRTVISLPGSASSLERIEPSEVLPGWSYDEVDALLRTGVFDDVVYSSVRFRHREMRELLTAQWANDLLALTGGRAKIEGLFFRTLYGEQVLVPRLRPILPWLLLMDDGIRDQALALEPQVATEGGDPSRLPLNVRRALLADIVRRIASENR